MDIYFIRDCFNNKRCKVCKYEGYLLGDELCEFYVEFENNVFFFVGCDNCFFNFYFCELNVFGILYKLVEYVF